MVSFETEVYHKQEEDVLGVRPLEGEGVELAVVGALVIHRFGV